MTLDMNDEQCKIFVGGLSWDTSDEKLKDFFSQFGHVVNACVMKNPETGRSRGFGFVSFEDTQSVQNVLTAGPQLLDGRTIDPKSCNSKNAHKDKQEAKLKEFPKVFLGGLPPDVNETSLRTHFSKYGRVIEVVIMYNQEKKSRGNGFRGFGFLSFESEDSVSALVSEHFVEINGKKVEVKRAEPRNCKLESQRGRSTTMDLLPSIVPVSTVQDAASLSSHCWSLSSSTIAPSASTSPTGTAPPPPPPPSASATPSAPSNYLQTTFMAPAPFCLPPSIISPLCVASAPWTSLSSPMPGANWPCPNVPSNFWPVPSLSGLPACPSFFSQMAHSNRIQATNPLMAQSLASVSLLNLSPNSALTLTTAAQEDSAFGPTRYSMANGSLPSSSSSGPRVSQVAAFHPYRRVQ